MKMITLKKVANNELELNHEKLSGKAAIHNYQDYY